MAKTEHKLTVCGITQQLDPQYWPGWSDVERAALQKDAKAIGDVIAARLAAVGYMPESLYCVIHDKDTRRVWDEGMKQYVIECKPRHVHAVVKFVTAGKQICSGTLPQIAQAVGIEAQYVEKAPRGRYGYDNMLAYLIHIKYTDKAQYSPSEVYSTGAAQQQPDGSVKALYRDYADIYAERREEWETGRAAVQRQKAETGIDALEMQILTGEVTRNQVLLTDELYSIYARNKRRCDDAFDTYSARKIAKAVQAMEAGDFRLTVYYVTGPSHSGKSCFTDALVKRLIADAKERLGQDWTVCSAAASNPFDEYRGEEIMVMDDLRGMAMTASDWLKLLDPDRVNVGSARYHNRQIACRAVIINSERDVLDFFYYVKGSGDRSEAMDQFFRRILARVIVYRVGDVRRLRIGHMQETDPYEAQEPGKVTQMTLHHDFSADEMDVDYETALQHLSDLVMRRNTPDV